MVKMEKDGEARLLGGLSWVGEGYIFVKFVFIL